MEPPSSPSSSQGKSKRTTVKKPWTSEEDNRLLELAKTHGTSNWGFIAEQLHFRSGKQCRERYHNHLLPEIKKGDWTEEEDRIIMEMQSQIGNQWAKITKLLPGRTDNAVKNRWHATMRSKSRIAAESTLHTRSHPLVPALTFQFQGPICSSGEDLMALSYDHRHEHAPATARSSENCTTSSTDTTRTWNSLQGSPRFGNDSFFLSARPDGFSFSARSGDGFTFTARSTDENMADLRKFLELWDSENGLVSNRSRKNEDGETSGSPRRVFGDTQPEFIGVLKRFDISPRFDPDACYQSSKRQRIGKGGEVTPEESAAGVKPICWTPSNDKQAAAGGAGGKSFVSQSISESDYEIFSNLTARSIS